MSNTSSWVRAPSPNNYPTQIQKRKLCERTQTNGVLLHATKNNTGCEIDGTFQKQQQQEGASSKTDQNQSIMDIDENNRRLLYLQRIGFDDATEIGNFLSRGPNISDLQCILTAHLLSVPFENMDQHSHPADGTDTPAVPKKSEADLPSLNVFKSLDKIIFQNRGGFCFELNFSFCWLLRSLGYKARLALADVGCQQQTPAHVVILVDGLLDDNDDTDTSLLVDVGFGLPGVCEVVLPLQKNKVVMDSHGDQFRFDVFEPTTTGDKNSEPPVKTTSKRFDTVLYRTRIDTGIEEPMYCFHSKDSMDFDSVEFAKGLERVLTVSPTFTGKRLCVVSTKRGHVTLGSDYVKWVEKWETVHQIDLPTEREWRLALEEHFGITLIP